MPPIMAINAPSANLRRSSLPLVKFGNPYKRRTSISFLPIPTTKEKLAAPQIGLPNLFQAPPTIRDKRSKLCSVPSRRLHANAISREDALHTDEPCFMELPCLSFTSTEVFVPSATTTLHLYEARFLALLEETEPYLKGIVQPMQDEIPEDSKSVNASVEELKLALIDLHCLQIKLKASKDEQLQTPLWNSWRWAEKEDFLNFNKAFVPRLAERISFAALQPVAGATVSELQALLQAKLNAMESTSTSQRLGSVTKLVKESKALTAAKLALQSLEL